MARENELQYLTGKGDLQPLTQPNKPALYKCSTFQRKVNNECKMSENRGVYDKKMNWYVLLDWSGQSRTFVKFIFHA